MESWLKGVKDPKHLAGRIYEIQITGYGPAEVGPNNELKKHAGVGSGMEVHHIVAIEHLLMVATPYSKDDAPSVAISPRVHYAISARISSEQGGTNTGLGGRPGGYKASASRQEIRELYRQVYSRDTSFLELHKIAENVLR